MGMVLSGVVLVANPAYAENYIVNTLNDNTTDDSFCTLREAINAANNTGGSNTNCGTLSNGNDTINFSVSGTVTLSSVLPNIVSGQGTLAISGTGQSITISGNNSDRVFFVDFGNLTLDNLTISNGNGGHGGGIFNYGGTVTVNNSTFSGNSSTTLAGSGIGIESGTVNIKNSIVANSLSQGNCYNSFGGSLNATGKNFDTDGTCAALDSDFAQVTSTQLDLATLQVNPPGTTATHALGTSSVAIGAVTDCTFIGGGNVNQDQRGVSRPQGTNCDVGAFELVTSRTLTITGAGTGSGTVTESSLINCTITSGLASGDCSDSYNSGSTVTLIATAGANSVFASWSGDCDSSGQVTMTADKSCTATFNLTPPSVAATKEASNASTGSLTSFVPGGTIKYTVVLTNTGGQAQPNNSGDEFSDTISSLAMLNAAGTASSGTLTVNPSLRKVTWNGSIPAGSSVTLNFSVRIPTGIIGIQRLCNQGTAYFDADGNSSNETQVLTTDPTPLTGAPSGQTCVDVTGRPERLCGLACLASVGSRRSGASRSERSASGCKGRALKRSTCKSSV
jgi:CSLREA domain-containing protein